MIDCLTNVHFTQCFQGFPESMLHPTDIPWIILIVLTTTYCGCNLLSTTTCRGGGGGRFGGSLSSHIFISPCGKFLQKALDRVVSNSSPHPLRHWLNKSMQTQQPGCFSGGSK